MTDQLTLAVNHALNDARMARARMGLMAPTMGLDNKRHSAWCEYGFPEQVTYENLYALYRRGGIAHGAVEKLVGKCWQTNPEIIEGDDADESKDETAWEKNAKKVFTKRLWRAFAEADRRRLVGRYAGILLHINDSRTWDQPVVRGKSLKKVTIAWAGSLTVSEWVTDQKSADYGQPKQWKYVESLPNGGTNQRFVHPDRVFILGDYSNDAIGFLEPPYNAFVSLEKVEGGSGESFLKNASNKQAINFEKDIDFANLASLYGVSVDELQERYNEAARELNVGNDVLLITQGRRLLRWSLLFLTRRLLTTSTFRQHRLGWIFRRVFLSAISKLSDQALKIRSISTVAASHAAVTCHSKLKTSVTSSLT